MLVWIHQLLPHFPRFGYFLVFVVLLFNNLGIPLPGDTVLLGAGFILGKNTFSWWQPMAAATAACFIGGIGAYWIGRGLGRSAVEKIRWLHLTKRRIRWSEWFFRHHGPKTIFFARFVFFLPPFTVNALAGMSKMRWAPFLFYNATGSAAYSVGYLLIGYFFGKRWKTFVEWTGPAGPYLLGVGAVLVVLAVVFRRTESKFLGRLLAGIRIKQWKGHS